MTLKAVLGAEVPLLDEPITFGTECTRDTGTKRTGFASYKLDMTVAAANAKIVIRWELQSTSHWADCTGVVWATYGLYSGGAPTGGNIERFPALVWSDASTWYFRQLPDDFDLYDFDGSAVLDNYGSNPFTTSAWNDCKLEIDRPNKRIRFWIDSTLVIDYTHGSALPGDYVTAEFGGWNGKAEAGLGISHYQDDILCISDSGVRPNTELPLTAHHVYLSTPTGDTAVDDWDLHPDTGEDKWEDWDDGDDGGASDADTTYLDIADGTTEERQVSAMEDCNTIGMDGGDNIWGAMMVGVWTKTAGSGAYSMGFEAITGSDVEAGRLEAWIGVGYQASMMFLHQTPGDEDWTQILFNSLGCGTRRFSGYTSQEFRCTEVYAYVASHATAMPALPSARRIFIT